jgi:hypothetical protein
VLDLLHEIELIAEADEILFAETAFCAPKRERDSVHGVDIAVDVGINTGRDHLQRRSSSLLGKPHFAVVRREDSLVPDDVDTIEILGYRAASAIDETPAALIDDAPIIIPDGEVRSDSRQDEMRVLNLVDENNETATVIRIEMPIDFAF